MSLANRQRPPGEEVCAQGVDGKEPAHEFKDILLAREIVPKAFGRVPSGDLADRGLSFFKHRSAGFLERVVAPVRAEPASDFTQLTRGFAVESGKRPIALAHALGLSRDDQASFERDARHDLVGAAVLERLSDPKRKIACAAHMAISGTPASVSS